MSLKINILPSLKQWFIEKSNLITSWSSTASDDKVASEKLVKTELDKKAVKTDVDTALATKIDKTSIKTSITNSLTNSDVVGGKALYDRISEVGAGIPEGMEHTDITDWDTATSGFETTTNKTTSISSSASDTKYPTEKAVYDLYAGIPKWDVQRIDSVDSLPTTGVYGTIYLVSNGGSGKNQYDEYFWNDKEDIPGYEKFDGLEIDISNLVTMDEVIEYIGNNGSLSLDSEGNLSLTIN